MIRFVAVVITAAFIAAGCAPGPDTPVTEASPDQDSSQPSEDPTVVGSAPLPGDDSLAAAATGSTSVPLLAVGDIASCRSEADEKVARLARERSGKIAILGDSVYDKGTAAEFAQCFDPAWGSMAARFRPALGNHEYATDGANPYWDYFGDWTGRRGKGWYAYNLGEHWRAIALNSNCTRVGGCHADSPQGRWLAKAIANAGDRHILAYWHAPLFSSGQHGPSPKMKPFFRMLYRARAAIVLNGHDHIYERFAPQNHNGERRRRGVQQFTVGTGGYKHYTFQDPLPTTRVRDNTTFGLLELRLRPAGYSWTFVPAEGDFTDSGSRSL